MPNPAIYCDRGVLGDRFREKPFVGSIDAPPIRARNAFYFEIQIDNLILLRPPSCSGHWYYSRDQELPAYYPRCMLAFSNASRSVQYNRGVSSNLKRLRM